MQDSFFAQLIFLVEDSIVIVDIAARDEGIILKDSQIQSALVKAKALVSGKAPKIEESKAAERMLKTLILRIGALSKGEREWADAVAALPCKTPVRPVDWVLAIEALLDSIKVRRSNVPGARDYLDFVHGFIEQARAEAAAKASARKSRA